MEGSGETECSRTSPNERNDDEDENEDNNESFNLKDGRTSSNSSVEEIEKKPSVRPYVRSKTPRLRWTPDLHLRFLQAVERLGGQEKATPKLVLQLMNIRGLNIAHVKSHLQMHRSKKFDEPNRGIFDHSHFIMEGIDHNICNLSQLPLLPSFNQRHHSNYYRYKGDASWNTHAKWMYNLTISGSNNYSSTNLDICTRQNNEDFKDEFGLSLHNKQELIWRVQSRQNRSDHHFTSLNLVQQRTHCHEQRILSESSRSNRPNLDQMTSICRETGFKRKAPSFDLDLNLSLGLESTRNGEENLPLSLYAAPSPSMLICKRLKEDFGTENARGASTLDLTL